MAAVKRKMQQQQGGAFASSSLSSAKGKSHLIKPSADWPIGMLRSGMSVRRLTGEEVRDKAKRDGWEASVDASYEEGRGEGGEQWWTVEYNKKYKSMTKAFMRVVSSGGRYFLDFSMVV
jgi:hypothetical protein